MIPVHEASAPENERIYRLPLPTYIVELELEPVAIPPFAVIPALKVFVPEIVCVVSVVTQVAQAIVPLVVIVPPVIGLVVAIDVTVPLPFAAHVAFPDPSVVRKYPFTAPLANRNVPGI